MSSHFKVLPRCAQNWRYDLTRTTEPTSSCEAYRCSEKPPNYIDDIHLELPRTSIRVRGISVIGGSFIAILNVTTLSFFVYGLISDSESFDIGLTIIGIGLPALIYYAIIPTIHIDLNLPRDEPIRFNLRRQKICLCQFDFDRFRIFSDRLRGGRPKVHDWNDVKAEACRVYAPGNGGLVERVFLTISKPGTNDVGARYFFPYDIHLGTQYWELARLYMQQGPDVLPSFVHPPKDWNNDNEVSFIHRLGPKGQWPADMDLESRTSPPPGKIQ